MPALLRLLLSWSSSIPGDRSGGAGTPASPPPSMARGDSACGVAALVTVSAPAAAAVAAAASVSGALVTCESDDCLSSIGGRRPRMPPVGLVLPAPACNGGGGGEGEGSTVAGDAALTVPSELGVRVIRGGSRSAVRLAVVASEDDRVVRATAAATTIAGSVSSSSSAIGGSDGVDADMRRAAGGLRMGTASSTSRRRRGEGLRPSLALAQSADAGSPRPAPPAPPPGSSQRRGDSGGVVGMLCGDADPRKPVPPPLPLGQYSSEPEPPPPPPPPPPPLPALRLLGCRVRPETPNGDGGCAAARAPRPVVMTIPVAGLGDRHPPGPPSRPDRACPGPPAAGRGDCRTSRSGKSMPIPTRPPAAAAVTVVTCGASHQTARARGRRAATAGGYVPARAHTNRHPQTHTCAKRRAYIDRHTHMHPHIQAQTHTHTHRQTVKTAGAESMRSHVPRASVSRARRSRRHRCWSCTATRAHQHLPGPAQRESCEGYTGHACRPVPRCRVSHGCPLARRVCAHTTDRRHQRLA
jgi:hypothetical protein